MLRKIFYYMLFKNYTDNQANYLRQKLNKIFCNMLFKNYSDNHYDYFDLYINVLFRFIIHFLALTPPKLVEIN